MISAKKMVRAMDDFIRKYMGKWLAGKKPVEPSPQLQLEPEPHRGDEGKIDEEEEEPESSLQLQPVDLELRRGDKRKIGEVETEEEPVNSVSRDVRQPSRLALRDVSSAKSPAPASGDESHPGQEPPKKKKEFQPKIRKEEERFQVITVDPTRVQPSARGEITQTEVRKYAKFAGKKSTPKGSTANVPKSECKHCHKKFSRFSLYLKHINSSSCKYKSDCFWCSFCDKAFLTLKTKDAHEKRHRLVMGAGQVGGAMNVRPMVQIENLHGCKVFRHAFEPDEAETVEAAFLAKKREMIYLVKSELRREKVVKFGTFTIGKFVVPDDDGGIEKESKIPLRSTYNILFLSDESRVSSLMTKCLRETLDRVEDLQEAGSGWTLSCIDDIRLAVGKCTLHGGAGGPKEIIKNVKGKEHLIDVPVDDDLCFVGSLAQHFLMAHTSFETKKWIAEVPMLDNIEFPMDFRKIHQFEERNKKLNVGINVFLKEGGMTYPVHRSQAKTPGNYANLLLLPYDSEGEKKWHYVYIRDLDGFLSYYKSHDGTKRRQKSVHCTNCLSNFTSDKTLKIHEELCFSNKTQLIVMPKPDEKIEFKNHLKQFGHEFLGFADLETILIPADRKDHPTCKNCQRGGDISKCKHVTRIQNMQEAFCYSLVFVDRKRNVVFQRTETDADIMPKFFKAMSDAETLLLPQLQAAKLNMIWTDRDQERYESSHSCHVCGGAFEEGGRKGKVRDHDHRTGAHLGAAHSDCNVNRRVKTTLLCYMHNFSGFDSHFVAKHYSNTKTRIKALAYNTERFRTLTLGKTVFMDSMSLLDAGLGELARDLTKEDHPFKILESAGIYESEEQKNLLVKGKGIFPYEYISSYDTLEEKELPPREKFYSKLRDEMPSEEEYEQAVKTFRAFGCRNIGDYAKLYCHLDTLLLAEVMSEFMDEAMEDFGLDASNYISLPQLSFDGMFKKFNLSLDTIPDPDMILLFESGIRGGVSYVSTRRVDVKEDGGILQYFDFSNLYGWAQMEKLPARNYRWLSSDEIEKLDIPSLPEFGNKGYALEVDLEYPENIRHKHRHMPMAPDHSFIFWQDLSDYSKECLSATTGKKNTAYRSQKLCGNFHPKRKYFIHYRNLKLYLKHGLKLTKIHRVVEFEQEAFSRNYIKFTAHKRKTSKTAFKKRAAKLYANANFGKWIQNVRKYVDVKIVSKQTLVAKYMGQPGFIDFRVLNDDLIAVFMRKKKVVMDRKFSVGFTILELSKLKMYDCFYEMILPRLGDDNVDLLLSDTDSFILHIKNHTRDEVRRKLADIMDFSTLDKSDPLYCEDRSRVPGFLKDEIPQGTIEECIALRSKCYAFRSRDDKTREIAVEKKCKGIRKPQVKRLKIDTYRKCLADIRTVKTEITRIESRNHNVRTITQNKIALSSFDDKRFIKRCGIHSVPFPQDSSANACDRCGK